MEKEELRKMNNGNDISSIIQNFEKLDSKNFNLFKILGLSDYEIRHSNFLAWLFKDSAFRKDFVKSALGIEIDSSDKIEVNREQFFKEIDEEGRLIFRKNVNKRTVFKKKRYEDENSDLYEYYTLEKDKGKVIKRPYEKTANFSDENFKPIQRYIDINIIGKDFTITIENKIETGEHDFQCIAYKNYIEHSGKYEGKKHYYVYLAKNRPDDFPEEGQISDPDSVYPGYRFIDYKKVKELLGPKEQYQKRFGELEGKIVEHYAVIIEEWERLPKEYFEFFVNNEEKLNQDDYLNNKKFYALVNSDSVSSDGKRFAEVARQYFQEKKNRIDNIIGHALNERIVKDEDFFMLSYGRSGYARCIPLFLDVLGDEEKKTYLSRKNKNKKAVEKGKWNLKKEELCLQTVDYRAPRDGRRYMSIALIAGLKTVYSQNLCKKFMDFTKEDDSILNKLNELKKRKTEKDEAVWDIELKYYIRNGAGYIVEGKDAIWNIENIPTTKDECQKVFKEDYFKDLKAKDVFSSEYWKYINNLNELHIWKDYSKWIQVLVEYFVEMEGIDKTLEFKERFLQLKEDYSKRYSEWKEKHTPKVFSIDNIKNGIPNKEEEFYTDVENAIKNMVELDMFFEWLKEDEPEEFKELDRYKSIKDLGKKECLLEENLKKLILEVLPQKKNKKNIVNEDEEENEEKENDEESGKNKTLKGLFKDAIDKRQRKELSFGWSLAIVSEIKDVDITSVLNGENFDNCDYTNLTAQLGEKFKERTLEGLNVLGKIQTDRIDKTYNDFFKEIVFL